MPIQFGNNNIKLDGISEVYVGSNKVYSATPPDYSTEYFFVENLTNSDNTLNIRKSVSGAPTLTVYYSTDKTNWSSISTSTTDTSINIPTGSKVYLKCSATRLATTVSNYNYIRCSSNFGVGGNIMSLLVGDNFIGTTALSGTYSLLGLFSNSTTLININKLVLPATTLTARCYYQMFSGCTGLTSIPSNLLPATTIGGGGYCYYRMFYGCSGLTSIPSNLLPATTLANYCYNGMFYGCRGLISIPSNLLPSTTLAQACYNSMFFGCTSLTTTPELPATTLAQGCYQGMFQNCTSLTTAPELPATTLTSSCYASMFQFCTGITKAPDLPATTLTTSCYSLMFRGCSSLNEIICYANDISATNCTYQWVDGVASSGTFYKRGDAAWTTGVDGIPTGWTVIDDRPYNPINDYFWIENRKSSSDTIRFTFIVKPTSTSSNFSPTISTNISDFFYYSTDKSTWTPHTATNLTIPANTRYYFYSNRSEGPSQKSGSVSSGKAYPYFDSFGGLNAAAKINGSFQNPSLFANLGFGGNASSNLAIGGNIRTLLGKGKGGVGNTSLIERGSKYSLSVSSYNECAYIGYTALGTSSTSFSNSQRDLGLFFTGITDAGNLYIGNSDHEAEFSLITPTTLPIYT